MTMTSGSLAERRAFWAANERNTDPADPAAVQAAVDALWSAAGAKPPKVVLCASPTRLAMTRFLWHWLPIGALSAAAAVVAALAVGAFAAAAVFSTPVGTGAFGFLFTAFMLCAALFALSLVMALYQTCREPFSFYVSVFSMCLFAVLAIVAAFDYALLYFSADRASHGFILTNILLSSCMISTSFVSLSMLYFAQQHGWKITDMSKVRISHVSLHDFCVTTRPSDGRNADAGGAKARSMIGSREDLEDAVRGEADPGVVALLTLCGPVYPGVLGHAFVLDRPAAVAVDTEGRLHNSEGPAVVWRDGARMFFLRGHEVTEEEAAGQPTAA